MTQLEEEVRQRKVHEGALKELRASIDRHIIDLLKDGVEPKDAALKASVSYEKVRTLARAHGIDRLREPTVRSVKRKKA